jgi:hypothetical protein
MNMRTDYVRLKKLIAKIENKQYKPLIIKNEKKIFSNL